ncbi:hypothetical protein EDB87DRAFT_1587886 [Lactarius vividus]|nr:hypothetical protein EDB87DRAFT_1587886 [Lactarius vividus]
MASHQKKFPSFVPHVALSFRTPTRPRLLGPHLLAAGPAAPCTPLRLTAHLCLVVLLHRTMEKSGEIFHHIPLWPLAGPRSSNTRITYRSSTDTALGPILSAGWCRLMVSCLVHVKAHAPHPRLRGTGRRTCARHIGTTRPLVRALDPGCKTRCCLRTLMFASSSALSPVRPRRPKTVTMTSPIFSVCAYKVRENPKCGRVSKSDSASSQPFMQVFFTA